jgi:hypothetical protein
MVQAFDIGDGTTMDQMEKKSENEAVTVVFVQSLGRWKITSAPGKT